MRVRRIRAPRGEVSIRKLGTFYWFGKAIPIVVGVDLTPDLAREYADPTSHRFVVDRIAAAIGESYVYETDQELPLDPVKAKIEEAIRARFGRPGVVQVNLSGIVARPVSPHVDAPQTFAVPDVPRPGSEEPADIDL